MLKQNTLKGSFSLCGKGLHTGLSLTVTFNPAPENTGYKIQSIDLDGMPIIDALAEMGYDKKKVVECIAKLLEDNKEALANKKQSEIEEFLFKNLIVALS